MIEPFRIFIIDDEEPVRRGLSLLLRSAGYRTELYTGAEEFLELENYTGPGCILLDIFLNGKSGLELLEEIKIKFCCLPVIYITGHGDVPASVQAFRKGALHFLQKPIDETDLLEVVDEACSMSMRQYSENKEVYRISSLFSTLTPRETQVLRHLLTGLLNKQIASLMNITEHTVKLHRGQITRKLGVKSVAELVIMAEKIRFS